FVPVERSLRPRVGLFAPLRDKVTSSAQSLVAPSGRPSQRSGLPILTEPHDELCHGFSCRCRRTWARDAEGDSTARGYARGRRISQRRRGGKREDKRALVWLDTAGNSPMNP